jgi:hypothetical protein
MMGAQHDKFLARLRGSKQGVFVVGYWLNSRGYDVEIPASKEAPTAAEHANFIDSGDLFASKAGRRLRLEVKTLGVEFSGRQDWPFPEVFVASVLSVNRSIEDVYAWMSVSSDLAAAAMVEATTWPVWYRVTVTAGNTGNEETCYAAPLEVVKFVSLAG